MSRILYATIFTIFFLSANHAQVLLSNINDESGGIKPDALIPYKNSVIFNNRDKFYIYDEISKKTSLLLDVSPNEDNASAHRIGIVGDLLLFISNKSSPTPTSRFYSFNIKNKVLTELTEPSEGYLGIDGTYLFSEESYYYQIGNKIYFINSNFDAGVQELWSTDGTREGTEVVAPFPSSGYVEESIVFNDELYFVVNYSDKGIEIWKSDTESLTRFFNDAELFDDEHYIADLTAINNGLYFFHDDGVHGRQIWKTDGSIDGTTIFLDVVKRSEINMPYQMIEFDDNLNFINASDNNAIEMWRSNGSDDNVELFSELKDSPYNKFGFNFISTKKLLFFTPVAESLGVELWQTDGTQSGTKNIKDICEGVHSAFYTNSVFASNEDYLIFSATTRINGLELWSHNLESGETTLIRDIFKGEKSSRIRNLISKGEKFYFFATDGKSGVELWESDGTTAQNVFDFVDEDGPSYPTSFFKTNNNTIIFNAYTRATGGEPYVTDGTSDGTYILGDINEGTAPSAPGQFKSVNDKIFFTAYVFNNREGIYVNNRRAVLFFVQDTLGVNDNLVTIDFNTDIVSFNGKVVADGSDGTTKGIYVTDGTQEGTEIIKETSGFTYFLAHSVNGIFYFITEVDDQYIFYQSDGTAEGTKVINTNYTIDSRLGKSIVFEDKVIFTASSEQLGEEVWASSGDQTAYPVGDIYPGVRNSDPTNYTYYKDAIYFTARNGTYYGVYKTEGEPNDVALVANIGNNKDDLAIVTTYQGELILTNGNQDDGYQIWKSDGTQEGTSLVKDFDGITTKLPDNFYAGDSFMIFNQETAENGRELWVSDGTNNGTYLLRDLKVGSESGNPQNFTQLGRDIIFSYNAEKIDAELFKMPVSEIDKCVAAGSEEPCFSFAIQVIETENFRDEETKIVKSSSQSPLQDVNVTLYQVSNDTSIVNNAYTDPEGLAYFSFMPKGEYIVGVDNANFLIGKLTEYSYSESIKYSSRFGPYLSFTYDENTDPYILNMELSRLTSMSIAFMDFSLEYDQPDQSVDLDWVVTATSAIDKFLIYRGTSNTELEEVSQIEVDDNTLRNAQYHFEDGQITATETLYYQIVQVNLNGDYYYSDIKSVNPEMSTSILENGKESSNLFSIYPNPATNEVLVESNPRFKGDLEIQVLDVKGSTIIKIPVDPNSGSETLLIDVANLPSGVFYIKATSNALSQTQKLVILNR